MLIEVDEYKEKISGYVPEKSEEFHVESAKLADRDFKKELKSRKYKRFIMMAGGTASGKTEYAKSYLIHKDQLVYDGTLKNIGGFKVKKQNILRYCKNEPKIKIVYIIPKDWIRSFEVFLVRKRKMNKVTFFETHIKSALTIAKLFIESKVRIEIYHSEMSGDVKEMVYERFKIVNRKRVSKELELYASFLKDRAEENNIALDD